MATQKYTDDEDELNLIVLEIQDFSKSALSTKTSKVRVLDLIHC